MKLLNVGKRTFVTPYGKFAPMDTLDFDDKEGADFLECYQSEVKRLTEETQEEAKASTDSKKKK